MITCRMSRLHLEPPTRSLVVQSQQTMVLIRMGFLTGTAMRRMHIGDEQPKEYARSASLSRAKTYPWGAHVVH